MQSMHYVKKYAENAKDAEYRKIQKRPNMHKYAEYAEHAKLQNMQNMQNMQSCLKKSTPGSVVPFAMFNKTLP